MIEEKIAKVRFVELVSSGDERGGSYQLPFGWNNFLAVEDIHPCEVMAYCIRGNHAHVVSKEIALIHHVGPWFFHYDEGEGTQPQHIQFEGVGMTYIEIEPGCAHAYHASIVPFLLITMKDTPKKYRQNDIIDRKVFVHDRRVFGG